MTVLADVLDPDALSAEIEAGYVKANRHPKFPLTIYTYTRDCQHEGRWNAITTVCRGLIADDAGNIIARPFGKFFNYGEHGVRDYAPPLPIEPFEVYEKLDGSLPRDRLLANRQSGRLNDCALFCGTIPSK